MVILTNNPSWLIDSFVLTPRSTNVFSSVSILKKDPIEIHVEKLLIEQFQKWLYPRRFPRHNSIERERERERSNRLLEKSLNNRSLYTHDHQGISERTTRREKGKLARSDEGGRRSCNLVHVGVPWRRLHTEREKGWDCDKSKVQGGNSHGAWKKRGGCENASRRKGHALLWLRMIICPPIRTVCESREILLLPCTCTCACACVRAFLLVSLCTNRG